MQVNLKVRCGVKHTPGPWGWHNNYLVTANRDGSVQITPQAIIKIDTFVSSIDSDEFKANQALMATAPELLEILKTLIAGIQGPLYNIPNIVNIANVIIAKAEGRDEV